MNHAYRMLILEDDKEDTLLLKEMIAEAGTIHFGEAEFRCVYLSCLKEGLEYLNSHPVDIILLDLFLPDSHGLATLESIRETGGAGDIPIIILTVLDSKEAGIEAVQMGAQEYLVKSETTSRLLLKSIYYAIERQQLKLALEKETRELEQSEDQVIKVITNVPDGVLIVEADAPGNVCFMNPAAEKLLGQPGAKLPAKLFGAGFPIKENEPIEIEIVHEKGDPAHAVTTAEIRAVEIDWKEKPAWLISLRDISGKKKLIKAFLEEKERLDVTLGSLADGVIAADEKGIVRIMNWMAGEMTGRGREQAIGKNLVDVLTLKSKTAGRVMNISREIIEEGKCIKSSDADEWLLVPGGDNGVEIPVEFSCAPVRKAGKVMGMVWVIRDVTEKREMEEETVRLQNLEALGVLAGGIAHEYNNVLTSVLGYITLAQKAAAGDPEILTRLDKAEKAGLRAKEISARLLTFSKGGKPRREKGSIAKVLRAAAETVLQSPRIETRWRIAENLSPLFFDPGQVRIALENIFKNALEAMPGGGEIKIAAENIILPAFKFTIIKPGSYVKISIADQGTGIDKENLPKVFSPYFSTRENAEGMGLATVYSIVRRHGGWLRFKSGQGRGSIVTVLLPAPVFPTPVHEAKRKPAAAHTATKAKPTGTAKIKGKILVMDDEDYIREVAGDLLATLNYEARPAGSGEEALQLYRQAMEAGEPFLAVILDLVVPHGMGGKECVRELRQIDPGVNAIASSGYSNDPVIANYRRYGFRGVLPKPYRLDQLNDLLEQLQDEESKQ